MAYRKTNSSMVSPAKSRLHVDGNTFDCEIGGYPRQSSIRDFFKSSSQPQSTSATALAATAAKSVAIVPGGQKRRINHHSESKKKITLTKGSSLDSFPVSPSSASGVVSISSSATETSVCSSGSNSPSSSVAARLNEVTVNLNYKLQQEEEQAQERQKLHHVTSMYESKTGVLGLPSHLIPRPLDCEKSQGLAQQQLPQSPINPIKSTNSNISPIRVFAPTRKSDVYQQMYLDLGQRDFALPKVCRVCGMLFVHGVAEDAKQHARICNDYKFGVAFQMGGSVGGATALSNGGGLARPGSSVHSSRKPRIVANFSTNKRVNGCVKSIIHLWATGAPSVATVGVALAKCSSEFIVEVRSSDHISLRQKVDQVRAIVNQELGFPIELNSSADLLVRRSPRRYYLYVLDKRVVGMASAEPISQAYKLFVVKRQQGNSSDDNNNSNNHNEEKNNNSNNSNTLNSNDEQNRSTMSCSFERSRQAQKATVGIHQLWVHPASRARGIATRLIDAVRHNFVFGCVTVPVTELAFSSPTQAGANFAFRYTQTHGGGGESNNGEKSDTDTFAAVDTRDHELDSEYVDTSTGSDLTSHDGGTSFRRKANMGKQLKPGNEDVSGCPAVLVYDCQY